MDRQVTVAVVGGDTRRSNLAQALTLIAGDLRDRVAREVLIKPNLVSHRRPLASTHADALSATLDAVFAAGAESAVVAEGASDADAGFDRFGHRREALGRPVRFLDLNTRERAWESVELLGLDGTPRTARVSATVARSACRVSLALPKTHVISGITLSIKNMLSSIHPDDRVMMHGHASGGNGYDGWRKRAINVLKQDTWVIEWITRLLGRVKRLRNTLRGLDRPDGWERLSEREVGFLKSTAVLHRNLVALTAKVGPHVSVIDGFVGMHREGPKHGAPIPLGVAIAGTDPVAVDSVAAAVMGFDPRTIAHLAMAEAAGLGLADLDAIRVVGDPIAAVRRRFVPHSHQAILDHAARVADLAPTPAVRPPHAPRRTGVRTR
ncbi:MAG TPA: DUF362 domain-containing protein [Isosphaeraceae bacterium]|jgi:uncharacterized protein (DUF362 family)|nr:DUF362 domain-containing protein [Isosphaeraceae bacterium]